MEASTVFPSESKTKLVQAVHSSIFVDILNDPAVKFALGDVSGDVYLERSKKWVANSLDNAKELEQEAMIGHTHY